MSEHEDAYVPQPPSLLSTKRILWAVPLLALGVFAIARGAVIAGAALIAADLLVIPLVARFSRRGLFASGTQVPTGWEGPLPAEMAKTPTGLLALAVATALFGLLCVAGAVGRVASGVNHDGNLVTAVLLLLVGAAALASGRLFGGMLVSLRRIPGLLGNGERLVASCYGRRGDDKILRGEVVGATTMRVISVTAALRGQHVPRDSIPYPEITEVRDEFTDLEVISKASSIRVTRALPTHVAAIVDAIKGKSDAPVVR